MQQIIANLASRTLPVLPVIQVEKPEEILPVGEAMIQGGIKALEITLRTEAGLAAIQLAKKSLPDAIICAGTITRADQVHAAVDAGAEFIVTPGITRKILEAAAERKIEIVPGVATPSEVMLGMEFGLTHFKLFPASIVGGVRMLKALAGPFPNVKFCPTGGLNAENFMDYYQLPNVFCVGGSWMIVKEDDVFRADMSIQKVQEIAKLMSVPLNLHKHG